MLFQPRLKLFFSLYSLLQNSFIHKSDMDQLPGSERVILRVSNVFRLPFCVTPIIT